MCASKYNYLSYKILKYVILYFILMKFYCIITKHKLNIFELDFNSSMN